MPSLRNKKEPTPEKPPSWFRKKWESGKDKVYNTVQDALDKAQQRAVETYIKNGRFTRLSRCRSYNQINWADPQISLEVKLCDIRNLKLIRNGTQRDQFLDSLTDAERELYLNHRGADGKRYTDLEDGALMVELVKGIKKRWKDRKKGQDDDELTPEQEQAVMDALDSLIQDG